MNSNLKKDNFEKLITIDFKRPQRSRMFIENEIKVEESITPESQVSCSQSVSINMQTLWVLKTY